MHGTGTAGAIGPLAALAMTLAAGSAGPAAARAASPSSPFGDAYPEMPLCAVRPSPRAEAGPRADRGATTDEVEPVVRRVTNETPSATLPVLGSYQDLYEVEWNGLNAAPVTADVPFLVRSNVAGITIRAEAPGSGLLVSVELVSPTGELIACRDCEDAPAVAEVEIDRGTLQMPSTDRDGWELTPGEYAFRVRVLPPPPEEAARADDEEAVVNVLATFRTDASVSVEYVLDLNFVYLPGCALSAAIADTSLVFAAMMDTLRSYMAPTGIGIGEVTHVDLDLPGFGVIATWEEAGEMFRTTEDVGRPRALNVHCVEAFEAPLNPVVGLSGGIPGGRRNGEADSGIAVRTSPLFICWEFCLPAFGSLFAHEIGHYLGLYHTSESTRLTWDPFSDTPDCTLPTGLDQCPDHDYVMYPLIHPANTIWSPGQIETVKTHPLVRSMPVVGGGAPPAPDTCALAFAPNPFHDTVRIEWPDGSGASTRGRLRIHDVTGRLVRTLAPGTAAVWDGRDDAGNVVAPGAYFARLRGGGAVCTGRIVRLP